MTWSKQSAVKENAVQLWLPQLQAGPGRVAALGLLQVHQCTIVGAALAQEQGRTVGDKARLKDSPTSPRWQVP